MRFIFLSILVSLSQFCYAQDDTVSVGKKVITLSPVVAGQQMDVPHFIEVVKNDSSFYKAFKNLRILGYTSKNDIRMQKKNGDLEASLYSTIRQNYENGCRTMDVLDEKVTGDLYDADGDFNYYTAKMYASLFFTKGEDMRGK